METCLERSDNVLRLPDIPIAMVTESQCRLVCSKRWRFAVKRSYADNLSFASWKPWQQSLDMSRYVLV